MKNFSLPSFPGSPGTRGSSFQDDSASQVSDMSYTSNADGSWMRRLSSTFSANDPSIDDAMRDLYGDPVRPPCPLRSRVALALTIFVLVGYSGGEMQEVPELPDEFRAQVRI